MFTHSFYIHISQKSKKVVKSSASFCAFGICACKASSKMFVKLTPGVVTSFSTDLTICVLPSGRRTRYSPVTTFPSDASLCPKWFAVRSSSTLSWRQFNKILLITIVIWRSKRGCLGSLLRAHFTYNLTQLDTLLQVVPIQNLTNNFLISKIL